MKPGDTIGQYEIESLLGRGGMGTVYAVKHRVLGGRHALKVLHSEIAESPEGRERFRREARVMHDLGKAHENILEVEEYGEEPDGTLWLKMPLMAGMPGKDDERYVTLQDRMDAEGRLPEKEVKQLLAQILEGLGFAHKQGALHRDLKPANILLAEDGSVRISDFGLVKVVEGEWLQSQFEKSIALTAGFGRTLHEGEADPGASTEALVGTWTFLAPEVKKGRRSHCRERSVAGRAAGISTAHGKRNARIRSTRSRGVPGLDPKWDLLILRATAEDAADRFESAEKFADAIPGRGGKKNPPAKRRRRSLAGAAVVATAALAFAALIFDSFRGGETPPAPGTDDVDKGSSGAQGTVSGTKEVPETEVESPDKNSTHSTVTIDVVNPIDASEERPFVNSLGMEFVPVEIGDGPTQGQRMLFSIWETRVQDFEGFAAESPGIDMSWKDVEYGGFGQGPDHPVVNVSWEDAGAFCSWLTETERAAGRIGARDEYRLPTDIEWSWAVGIGEREDAVADPEEKDGKLKGVYPWGTQWPPPANVGNLGGQESASSLKLDGYRDDHPFTAPVGSYVANDQGLFDLSGNVWEWCEDEDDPSEYKNRRVLRGSSWFNGDENYLLSSLRLGETLVRRVNFVGFRVVLSVGGGAKTNRSESSQQIESNTDSGLNKSRHPSDASKDRPFVNSIGMKFVPVSIGNGPTKEKQLLFSVWETRVQDFGEFAKRNSVFQYRWEDIQFPGHSQEPNHPVANVNWEEAKSFCAWLTKSERESGKIDHDDKYRLPSDVEWSWAVGIGEQELAAELPRAKDCRITGVYPWGTEWPPPDRSGNYSSDETDVAFGMIAIAGFSDGYAFTSPAGSHQPNENGLFDLGGNVWEMCEGNLDQTVLRGAAWNEYASDSLFSSRRLIRGPEDRDSFSGFRVILELGSKKPSVRPVDEPLAVKSVSKNHPFVNLLGMRFVPVPGTGVSFFEHETRVQDYAVYANEQSQVNRDWENYEYGGCRQGPDHPVVNLTWKDAQQFCECLSEKEEKSYRLPTDLEWSVAVGIGGQENPSESPDIKAYKLKGVFPWGTTFPPPNGAGNFLGEEAKHMPFTQREEGLNKFFGANPNGRTVIDNYSDGFAFTAPVKSFRSNRFGIFDMEGNVEEYCESLSEFGRVSRRASWAVHFENCVHSSHRSLGLGEDHRDPNSPNNDTGFRCVLELSPASIHDK